MIPSLPTAKPGTWRKRETERLALQAVASQRSLAELHIKDESTFSETLQQQVQAVQACLAAQHVENPSPFAPGAAIEGLVEALKQNSTTYINLGGYYIGDRGAKARLGCQ